MFELHTEIEIHAPAAVVWALLADFEAYPDWNPFMRRIAGTLAEGERIEVTLEAPGSKPMLFRPTLLRVEPERGLTWLGRLAGVPKLFDGEHTLAIEPLGPNVVRFVHRERFGGVLLPFLRKMLDTGTRAGFEAMNLALKQRAEAIAATEHAAAAR